MGNHMRTRFISCLTAAAVLAAAPAAHAVGVDPAKATPEQRNQAQARFLKGKDLYDAHRYDEALAEFRGALDVVATPNARLYVARCDRETGKLVEAYAEFDRTAIEANADSKDDPRYARTAASAANERDALSPQLGFVTVHVSHAGGWTKLVVGGNEVPREAWERPVPVTPGATDVSVETPSSGTPPVRQSLTVAAGDKKEISIDAAAPTAPAAAPVAATPAQPPADHTSLRPYAYVAGGVGAAGLLTFAISGLLSNGTYSDLQSKCPRGVCPASASSEISRGRTEQTIANVGLVVGFVGLAAGAALFVISMPPKSGAGTTASLVVGPFWSGFRGAF